MTYEQRQAALRRAFDRGALAAHRGLDPDEAAAHYTPGSAFFKKWLEGWRSYHNPYDALNFLAANAAQRLSARCPA